LRAKGMPRTSFEVVMPRRHVLAPAALGHWAVPKVMSAAEQQ